MSLLEQINSPDDLKKHNFNELTKLCKEIRQFLLQTVSENGGHLASNLGTVELTVAIHKVFDTSRDRLIFDVGHQCYTHKILTGRREAFHTLRSYGGISGFPKPEESVHDAFATGHASTSVSAGLGMARARSIKNEDYNIITVIGDGALTGGMIYEALNDAGQSKERMIVILNDNEMSIQKNVGGVERQLVRLRLKPGYTHFKDSFRGITTRIPGGKLIYKLVHNTRLMLKSLLIHGSVFEDMGFTYLGPIDGHDVRALCNILEISKRYDGPVLLHLRTVKGKGYSFAEKRPEAYHGVPGFHVETGEAKSVPTRGFSDVFGEKLLELASADKRLCAITAAMQSSTGLDGFSQTFPRRFFDVGIAEEHAVTMAAGMAAQGLLPVFAVYSTFLQRSYDMLVHDVALGGYPVIFACDRAGLTGEDGETHQGVFDAAFLPQIPGMTVYCPSSFAELGHMLERIVDAASGPCALRYSRGKEGGYTALSKGSSEIICKGKDVTLVSYGIMINEALKAAEALTFKGISAEVVKLNQIAPLDIKDIIKSVEATGRLIVTEDCISEGSVGGRITSALAQKGVAPAIRLLNVKNAFVPHGDTATQRALCGIDSDAVYSAALEMCTVKYGIGAEK